ncbi:ribonuclease II [Rhodoferax lacus]|uniref:Ribonuclease II n=1 Tax=Rhodoferax lacus TaxID=2184758 RepID=A0A3E1RC39_9BURK|nr:RNB domain-containing ribonuclease [Rhodoferax lacus]RFO96926.1 ribonuclease II [Rhodoferax lacus]
MSASTFRARPPHHRSDLVRIAIASMRERQLLTAFSAQALQELASIAGAASDSTPAVRDLRSLLWCSIDNDDSLDLDQLTVCEALKGGRTRLLVAIADVDALVKKGSALDDHARTNTATIYTSACIFPMLPERLSTNLTSLGAGVDRLAVVTDMLFASDGQLQEATLYRATVHNQAKLAYDAVSLWIDGSGPLPVAAQSVPGMDLQLRQQDALAQKMRVLRHAKGSLEFETFAPRALFEGEQVVGIAQQEQNRARQLIEEFMIAANGCNARYLGQSGAGSLRRVVRSPDRWLRIVAVAKEYGEDLPNTPDSRALEAFLAKRHQADPLRFADLSLVIIKLMGSGEYVVEAPGETGIGHFGLAVRDYTHSTAPNRRYPDLITSRMLKAALAGQTPPYSLEELATLAQHCTRQEDAARKVERRMRKSDAALVLESRTGEVFNAIVTGNSPDGVWVRLLNPPVEGKLLVSTGPAIGAKLRVRLVSTNVERGFIDFAVEA